MRILRIVPMFNRQGIVDAYIPQLEGFTVADEIEALSRIAQSVPNKKWAFVHNSIPAEYQGLLINQEGGIQRSKQIRESNMQVIGYNFEAKLGVKELLENCSAVALNVHYSYCEQLLSLASVYGSPNLQKIALFVNTIDEYHHWKNEGFDYFIGDFYTQSVISGGQPRQKLRPIQANKLAVLAEVTQWENNKNADNFGNIAQIIQRDVFLTLSLIRMANSAFFGAHQKINELKDAIIRIGMDNLTKWSIAILSTAVTDTKTPEISRAALIRARFMENLAAWVNVNRWQSFFTGLASVAGAMLGASQAEALRDMNAPPEISQYLDGQGDIGKLYSIVKAYIQGDMAVLNEAVSQDPQLADRLHIAYISAETWVTEILKGLSGS